ncbi:hypothetical protein SODALDRAFT_381929 [Sodiomyces alkalinus F11]|uniref:Uncharacterized protein n=1 Tax=Sodiomyces alkalinus (strain CBS 110278 / VKM F-3762 / F11) TaxID=1314773 RepID=A0A3N2PKM0_SODAK|nr:hypothetical protein SODALDRAFT_381929 [Sodiomyces alkalinus F11]ROT34960.1 hypothetical protein SODALDRAFT_381929 [Sodiomyces alkalinus F11]
MYYDVETSSPSPKHPLIDQLDRTPSCPSHARKLSVPPTPNPLLHRYSPSSALTFRTFYLALFLIPAALYGLVLITLFSVPPWRKLKSLKASNPNGNVRRDARPLVRIAQIAIPYQKTDRGDPTLPVTFTLLAFCPACEQL